MASGVRKVVIAMDGSDHADYAFDWYMKHLRKEGDYVILVHSPEYHSIAQSPTFGMGELTSEGDVMEELEQESRRIAGLITRLQDRLKELHLAGEVRKVIGVPGHCIVKVADEENAGCIIAGTRGMGTLRRTLMGSVSDYIIHHSHVPVVVCRHKELHRK